MNLSNIIKKVIKEQLLGISRAPISSRFNLSKSSSSVRSSRLRSPESDGGGNDLSCHITNIKNTFDFCKKNKNKPQFKPDNESKKIAEDLHKNMEGLSSGSNTYKTINSIKDYVQFCKVYNSFNYDNETLDVWLNDEISIQEDILSPKLKKIYTEMGYEDQCDEREMI